MKTETFRGIPALDDSGLLEQNILYHREKGSDTEKNARNTVDLVALAGTVAPELTKEAIRAVNTIATRKTREIGELVKAVELDEALKIVPGVSGESKDMLKERYGKMAGRKRGMGITD
jgi:hypothetical protein